MTTAETFSNKNFMQMCWVVPDLRAAIDSWAGSTGVGPFFWFDGVDCVGGRYRGRPAEFPKVTAAIAYAGDIQIELVEQDNDDPGVFRDLFSAGNRLPDMDPRPGFHIGPHGTIEAKLQEKQAVARPRTAVSAT